VRVTSWLSAGCVLAALLAAGPAAAVGPVDVELEGRYWVNDFEKVDEAGDLDDEASAFGWRGRLWVGRFGVQLEQHSSDPSDVDPQATYSSAELDYKLFEIGDSFVSLGAGWQRNEYEFGSYTSTAEGLRVSAEVAVELFWILRGTARAGYYPDLGDMSDGAGSAWEDADGYDWELAVGIHPLPFLWFSAGYREAQIGADGASGAAAAGATEFANSGYFGAVGVKF